MSLCSSQIVVVVDGDVEYALGIAGSAVGCHLVRWYLFFHKERKSSHSHRFYTRPRRDQSTWWIPWEINCEEPLVQGQHLHQLELSLDPFYHWSWCNDNLSPCLVCRGTNDPCIVSWEPPSTTSWTIRVVVLSLGPSAYAADQRENLPLKQFPASLSLVRDGKQDDELTLFLFLMKFLPALRGIYIKSNSNEWLSGSSSSATFVSNTLTHTHSFVASNLVTWSRHKSTI